MSRPAGPEVASYAGGITSIASALTLTDIGVILGIVTALLTFVLNAVYMYRKDRREAVESAATIAALQTREHDDE